MTFEIRYDPICEKQLRKLSKEVAQRILSKIREVSETGRGIESLKDEHYGYKIRVGDYRVLVDLSFHPSTLWIRYIGHRKKIYKQI